LVYKTTDGGANWTLQLSGSIPGFLSIRFFDANTGWVVGNNGAIYYTANGGTNWTLQPSGITVTSINDISIFNATTAWVCGDGGKISKYACSPSSITLGVSPTVCRGTVSASLPYTATTGTPDTYSIDYDAAANTAGFVDVVNAALPVSPITLTVPGAAAGGTYNATITVIKTVGGCVSPAVPFTVSVNEPACSITGVSSVCAGTNGTSFSAPAGMTTYAWGISGNGTISGVSNAQNVSVNAGAAGSYTLTLTITNSNSCTSICNQVVTVNALTNTLGGTAGGAQVCANYPVVGGGTIYADASCNPVSMVLPSGGSPVSGTINTCVKIDASVQTYNGQAYVQRHYDITPATNPATATGTLTLYFTQSEFNNFNIARGNLPALPTGSGDAAGIANLRITQYHGAGTAPGNYSGSAVLIDPVDANIVYNGGAARWEVTFNVTGFSGFYVSTGSFVLPLTLLNFSGHHNGNYNILEWTTATGQHTSHFELQRSTDGYTYSAIGNIPAVGSNTGSTYNYNDNIRAFSSAIYYYRLKIVELSGKISYSNIILINLKAGITVMLYPNPVTGQLTIQQFGTIQNKTAVLSDGHGKILQQIKLTNLQQQVNMETYPSGVYMLKMEDGTVFKVVKQ
jgi:hypothetical protein